jgi:hypothetical protein
MAQLGVIRFSILYDDKGVILAVSLGDEDSEKLAPGLAVASSYLDLPEDMPDGRLQQAVERVLIDTDPRNPVNQPEMEIKHNVEKTQK